MLPLAANYRGAIDGKPIVSAEEVRSERGEDWFWVIRQGASSGALDAVVSLPEEIVLFVEYVPADTLPAGDIVENVVAVEKHHRRLTIYHEGGQAGYAYGESGWQRSDGLEGLAVPGNWVNLNERIGFLFAAPDGATVSRLLLPKPGARDAVRAQTPTRAGKPHLLGIVICPGQAPTRTAALASEVHMDHSPNGLKCTVGQHVVVINLGSEPLHFLSPGSDSVAVELPPGSVGAWLRTGQRLF
jgi:hypothetical protein